MRSVGLEDPSTETRFPLANAAKFTPTEGRLSVVVERTGSEAIIRVRDTGVGLSDVARGRIFDLFAQEDTTLARSRGGLGIGLALAKQLVELHGGRIEVRSDGPGTGNEFIVALPAIAADPAPSIGAEGAAPVPAGASVRLRWYDGSGNDIRRGPSSVAHPSRHPGT